MKRMIVCSVLAVALFLSLVALEALENWPDFTIEELLFDLFEIALLAGAVVATAYVSFEMREVRHEHATLIGDLSQARAEGDRWRATARVHIDGLHRAIRQQFEAWRLTASEADIALLMLKGLSHKEIARLRNSSEATVRQQATAIYGKSGLASRAALAAFFFEDLFASAAERGGSHVS
ncbi:MAG: response regulator transcription factor [Methyloceanibacter sp.]|uniref:helix-turn-helix transcriptional regulator n=1 Tax=Methyloceanibacter sp. TaxID=1965321 RepID=UPI003D6D2F38